MVRAVPQRDDASASLLDLTRIRQRGNSRLGSRQRPTGTNWRRFSVGEGAKWGQAIKTNAPQASLTGRFRA